MVGPICQQALPPKPDREKRPRNRFFPESYERFIGIYWGQVSTPFCAETVEASDAYIFAGPIFNDYTRCSRAVTCRSNFRWTGKAMHAMLRHCRRSEVVEPCHDAAGCLIEEAQ